jgi:hypothetical protein
MINPYKAAEAFGNFFGETEYALKRSGYKRKERQVAEVDWQLFANKLGAAFFNHIVEQEIAKTLIGHPPWKLQANMQWSPPSPLRLTNVEELVIKGVCRVRNSYIHGEKFRGGPEGQWERDLKLIKEAHAVLKEAMKWLSLELPQPVIPAKAGIRL